MRIFRALDSINTDRECAIALGLFDGLHKAHRAVIASALNSGLTPAVFTFTMNDNHPASKNGFVPLMSVEKRVCGIEKLGVELLLMPDFSEFANLSAEEFVEDVLFSKMKARVLCCGYDFRFGKGNSGDVNLLKDLCDRHGARLEVVDCITENGKTVSSSAVRTALSEGDMQTYFDMCGRFFSIESTVVHGNRIGRTLSFPTINQSLDTNCLAPRFGVYASRTHVGDKSFPSITNIGIKPTVSSESSVLAETYIFDFDGDLYGAKITVELMFFVRPERKFSSTDELKFAIETDIKTVKKWFQRLP